MQTKTKAALAVELETPPEGGDLSPTSTLDEDAHYLRVTLDKADNMKAAAGERLREVLKNKFNNNENALRDWYEENVAQGKEHRAWDSIRHYLPSHLKRNQDYRKRIAEDRDEGRRARAQSEQTQRDTETSTTIDMPVRPPKSEYEQRSAWLGHMNYLWFKGKPEWQAKWLETHGFRKTTII